MGCGNSVQVESRQAAMVRRRASAAMKKLDSKASTPADGVDGNLLPVAETVVVLDYEETPPPPQHTFDPKAQPLQSSLRPSDSITAGSSSAAMTGSAGLRKRGISFVVNRQDGAASPNIVRSPLPKMSDDESPVQHAQRRRRVSDEQLEHRLGDYSAVSGSSTPPLLFQPQGGDGGSHATGGSFGTTTLTESGENGPQASHSPQTAGCIVLTEDVDGDAPPIASWIQRTSTDSDEEGDDTTEARERRSNVTSGDRPPGEKRGGTQLTEDSSRLSAPPNTQQLSSTSSAQTGNSSSVAHGTSLNTSHVGNNIKVVAQPTV
jgi:hypothetical protein